MGAAAAAAVIIRKERELVERFREAGATSASTAKTADALGVHPRLAWERLERHAVIRPAAGGAYYLDEPSWEALRRMRRRVATVVLILFVLFGVVAALMR